MNVVGPEFDSKRIKLLGSNLEGDASDFYFAEVISPNREREGWTFRELVIALYDRFIPRTTRLTAVMDFEQCSYSSSDGVEGFWNRLKVIAARMPVHPDSYTMNRRLLNGLPKALFDPLTMYQGLSAEDNTARELIDAAKEKETALKLIRSHDNHMNDQRSGDEQEPCHDSRGPHEVHRPQRNHTSHGYCPGHQLSDSDNDDIAQHRNTSLRESRNDTNHQKEYLHSYSQRSSQSNSKPKPAFHTSSRQCFQCGKYGHIAANCNNSTTSGRARFGMVRADGDVTTNVIKSASNSDLIEDDDQEIIDDTPTVDGQASEADDKNMGGDLEWTDDKSEEEGFTPRISGMTARVSTLRQH